MIKSINKINEESHNAKRIHVLFNVFPFNFTMLYKTNEFSRFGWQSKYDMLAFFSVSN